MYSIRPFFLLVISQVIFDCFDWLELFNLRRMLNRSLSCGFQKPKQYKHISSFAAFTTNINVTSANEEKAHSPGFSIKGKAKEGRPVYLDFQATTPTDPRVVDAMVNILHNINIYCLIGFILYYICPQFGIMVLWCGSSCLI